MRPANKTRVSTGASSAKLLLLSIVLLSIVSATALQRSTAADQNPTDRNATGSTTGNTTGIELPQLVISTSTDRSHAYINEQVLITVDVLVPESAFNVRQEKLTVPGADVFTLSKTISNTVHNDQPYQRISSRYALFFKLAGHQRVPSINTSATLPVSAGGADATSNPRISAASNPLTIDINPAPVAAASWLAAMDITAQSQWQFDGKNKSFVAGEPATRRYEVQISGQFPTAIPELNYSVPDGLRLYIDPPQIEKYNDKSGLGGTLTQVTTIIPNQAGVYQIPSLQIDWWDSARQQWKQTSIAADSINVKPSTLADSKLQFSSWKMATLLVMTTALATVSGGILLYQRRRTRTYLRAATRLTENQAWTSVKKALRAGNPHKTRSAVVTWYSTINNANTTVSIEQIGTSDTELRMLLNRLDALIYRNSYENKMDYRALKARLINLRKQLKQKGRNDRSGKRPRNESAGLIDLYPVRSGLPTSRQMSRQ